MLDATTVVPAPVNEPIRHYPPGSPERASLEARLETSMKAFGVFPGSKEVKLIADHPEPRKPSGTEVKLKMLEVGICGTDKEICSFEYGTPPQGDPYGPVGLRHRIRPAGVHRLRP